MLKNGSTEPFFMLAPLKDRRFPGTLPKLFCTDIMKKILIFLGPPGSGKGTQAKKIAAKYGYGHISTGDLLRALVKNGMPGFEKEIAAMKSGGLVSDQTIYDLVEREIIIDFQSRDIRGVVLDGVIRSVEQAEYFKSFFENKGWGSEIIVIDIQLSEEESLRRLTTRKVCQNCGTVITAKKDEGPNTCKCGGNIVVRSDDTVEVVKNRLEVQGNKALKPIREFYKNIIKPIDGSKSVLDVEKAIDNALK